MRDVFCRTSISVGLPFKTRAPLRCSDTSRARSNFVLVINQTLPIDAQMQVASLQETVTVTGESPVVDTASTTLGTPPARSRQEVANVPDVQGSPIQTATAPARGVGGIT
jgi:hypothetical protein